MTIRWIALACAMGVACAARAASPVVNETVAIVDPTTPSQQATVTSSGALKVDGSAAGGGAVTQSGTWTVQPGNTANTTPWLMTPVAGTTNGATPYFVQPTA